MECELQVGRDRREGQEGGGEGGREEGRGNGHNYPVWSVSFR